MFEIKIWKREIEREKERGKERVKNGKMKS